MLTAVQVIIAHVGIITFIGVLAVERKSLVSAVLRIATDPKLFVRPYL